MICPFPFFHFAMWTITDSLCVSYAECNPTRKEFTLSQKGWRRAIFRDLVATLPICWLKMEGLDHLIRNEASDLDVGLYLFTFFLQRILNSQPMTKIPKKKWSWTRQSQSFQMLETHIALRRRESLEAWALTSTTKPSLHVNRFLVFWFLCLVVIHSLKKQSRQSRWFLLVLDF